MRRVAAVFVVASWAALAVAGDGPARYVDPFIGTGGHGHTYPGATRPFGMVQLSPDTRLEGWDGCSAYHHTDDVVYGFSHTHLSGTGIPDYADVLLMPVTGVPLFDNGHERGPDSGYASRFDKSTERAGAGWYEVELADYDISVELTATERAGFHRYGFPVGRPAHVVVDLAHRDEVLDSSLRVVGEREIEGHRRSTGWAEDQVVYFVARFSRPFTRTSPPGEDRVENLKAVLSFGDDGGELLVQVGLSAVDIDGARRNLDAELHGKGFDEARRAAVASWDAALSRITVRGGTDDQRIIFYTALYHSLIAPNLYSDVDGRYRGMDHEIHRAEGRRHYTVFSLWDTFRATHPLYTLLEPVRTREFIETFLAMYEQGGRLPVWELAANETDTMIGYHAIPVIVDAWVKGIRGFDGELALEAMLASAERDARGLEAYKRQGFIGAHDEGESVSKTLEYAYDDWCIARMAREMGREPLARRYDLRSQSWRHVLDPGTGFMRARRNQRWLEPFDPRRVDGNYTEANAWQYSFFVPHDVEGLIEALGGEERFVERLDALFEAEATTIGRQQPDITGLIGQYAHGNEPSHHMAWLYHYAGRPGDSARRVRRILDEMYTSAPDGLSGNEDCGQMSSWYVMAAAGFYPVCPCTDEYVLGVPLFDEISIDVGGGRRFVIRTVGQGPVIASAELNGAELRRSYLRHAEIASGGELVLTLGAESGEWGRVLADRPRSRVAGERVLPAPFAVSDGDAFREELTVELACADPKATVHYTARDGDGGWQRYERPLRLDESTRLRFRAERDGRSSPTVEAYFHRIPQDWEVKLTPPPHPTYSASGKWTLIDGRRGAADWRGGGWLGFEAADPTATLDLGKVRPVSMVAAGFLQDVKSWIWMPTEVVFSVSTDGETYEEVASLPTDVPDDLYGIVIRDVTLELAGREARYVRVRAVNYDTCPAWHPGAGGKTWIFVDEIAVD